MRTPRERQVLPSSWISVSHVARPDLLDAAGIGGRRPSAGKPLTDGEIPLVASTVVGTAKPAFPSNWRRSSSSPRYSRLVESSRNAICDALLHQHAQEISPLSCYTPRGYLVSLMRIKTGQTKERS